MWNIQLLGGLSVTSPQRQITRFRTQKAASLLAYLAFHASPQPRETLIDMFWPDAEPEVGCHNLSNALSFLRHVLEPPGVPAGTVVLADRASVRINPAAVAVDAIEFESELGKAQVESLSTEERLARLLRAAEQYQGALLSGYYEEWIAPEAVRLESLFVQGVIRLVPLLLGAGKRELALTYAQRAVSADSLSEEATQCLIQALSACGQPGQALRAYRALERRLQEELDSQPSQALQNLATQLGQGGVSRTSQEVFVTAPSSPNKAMPLEPVLDTSAVSDTVGSTPRGRLVGAEFLLRTTTRFFDRKEEAVCLSNMLSTPRTRLVTLTGAGGIGKTRLALEVAAHLVETTADNPQADTPTSAVFVSLAPVTEAERLFEVTLRSLGIIPSTDQDSLDQLVSVLDSQPNTLLILDNFEQFAGEGALRVRDLLAKTASVKVLVTSRQRLHIKEEREFHLAPLPTSGGAQTLEELLNVPSIALFVDRAQSALPDFQLTERNAAVVAQLCDYLEGLPLAIELAATRVVVLSPARILEQVQSDRLDFLVTRCRDAEPRQRTLRATLDWGYQLLPEATRKAVSALSVFRGGWTLAEAEAVCALRQEETLALLMRLRDSSLIEVAETKDGLRFTMLETIREYSHENRMELDEYSVVGESGSKPVDTRSRVSHPGGTRPFEPGTVLPGKRVGQRAGIRTDAGTYVRAARNRSAGFPPGQLRISKSATPTEPGVNLFCERP